MTQELVFAGVKNFLFSTASRLDLRPTRPPTQWVPEDLSPEVKWQGHEADNSPPSNDKINNCGAIPPFRNILTLR
jgi:hypothetical protein